MRKLKNDQRVETANGCEWTGLRSELRPGTRELKGEKHILTRRSQRKWLKASAVAAEAKEQDNFKKHNNAY